MPRKPYTPLRDFFSGIVLLVGGVAVFLVLWGVAFFAFASLVFVALIVCTDWNLGTRIGCSVVTAMIFFKVLGLASTLHDLIPESWIDEKEKRKPCPECGENLRTAIAQQCMHCGADWHVKNRPPN